MTSHYLDQDFQTVSRPRSRRAAKQAVTSAAPDRQVPINRPAETPTPATLRPAAAEATTVLKRGHFISFAALFTFTVLLYTRPSELYPSPVTASLALVAGLVTLAFFVPTQLALEGNLTALPREVKFVLLFALTGVASIPLALNRAEAWETFSSTFIRCVVIFVVIVNVARTKSRLNALLYLALAVGVWLSCGAINDYR